MKLKKISETLWEVPKSGDMKVPGRIVANEQLMKSIQRGKAAEQVANVACLPGIVRYAYAMPDAHWGYGFPIGGVAATDVEQDGVISPGGVGYDINCGCRLMSTSLSYDDIKPRVRDIVTRIYQDVPCGVGSSGAISKLSQADMKKVLENGARWAIEQGFGTANDLEMTEDKGCIQGAAAGELSQRAIQRGQDQLGTLGAGNHFVELGVVEDVLDKTAADVFGLVEGQVTVMVHCGSRGLGYQVCDDSLRVMMQAAKKYQIKLPDRQLCCAPVKSEEGRSYLSAMAAAANFAWANRQIIMELIRRSISKTIGISKTELSARLVYDVCHNIAKLEDHEVDGKTKRLCVHRKGATRAFPGSRDEVPALYRGVGQPVLVPGDMGTGSYVCAGTEEALKMTFGSSCHGAGRVMSRTAARKSQRASELIEELASQGIVVMARSKKTLAEESPAAYKDIDVVVDVLRKSGISRPVARIRPIGVVKG